MYTARFHFSRIHPTMSEGTQVPVMAPGSTGNMPVDNDRLMPDNRNLRAHHSHPRLLPSVTIDIDNHLAAPFV